MVELVWLSERFEGGTILWIDTAEGSTDTDVGMYLVKRVYSFLIWRELMGVPHNNDRHLAVDWVELLSSRQDKHGRLSATRLRLAQDVYFKDCSEDILLRN